MASEKRYAAARSVYSPPAKPAATPYEESSFDTSAGRHTCTMFAVHIVQGSSRSNSMRKKCGLFSGTVSLLHSVEVRLPRMAQRVEQAGAARFVSLTCWTKAGRGSETRPEGTSPASGRFAAFTGGGCNGDIRQQPPTILLFFQIFIFFRCLYGM